MFISECRYFSVLACGVVTETGNKAPPGCPHHPSIRTPTGAGRCHEREQNSRCGCGRALCWGGSGWGRGNARQTLPGGRFRQSSEQSQGGEMLRAHNTPPAPHSRVRRPRTHGAATQDAFPARTCGCPLLKITVVVFKWQ